MDMYAMHREAMESTYIGKCNVIESVKKEKGSRTINVTETVIENQPCRLSRSSNSRNPTSQTDTTNNIDYNSVLFISPDVGIKAGSQIVVTQHGKTLYFKSTGESPIYITHQEIPLKRIDKA